MSETIEQLVVATGQKLIARQWKLSTAESCTAGGLSYWLTSVPGSSEWFDRGFVTYSNTAKEEMLDIMPLTLASFGAVSEQTAREMAENGLRKSQAQACIAITGIAGPSGGTRDKPVGTVWFAWSSINMQTISKVDIFSGSRTEVREKSIIFALEKFLELV